MTIYSMEKISIPPFEEWPHTATKNSAVRRAWSCSGRRFCQKKRVKYKGPGTAIYTLKWFVLTSKGLKRIASHQTKVKREEQEEQDVQNREQEETKDIWQETRNEKQETRYEQPESEKQKSTVGEKTKAERETEEDSLDFNWAGVNFSGRDAVASEKDIELGDEETRPDRQKGNNGRGLMIMSITCDKTMIGGMSATIFILAVTIGYFAWP